MSGIAPLSDSEAANWSRAALLEQVRLLEFELSVVQERLTQMQRNFVAAFPGNVPPEFPNSDPTPSEKEQ